MKIAVFIVFILSLSFNNSAFGWGSPKPRENYSTHTVEGFTVKIDHKLDSNPLTNQVLDRLRIRLKEAITLSPLKLGALKGRVTIWLSNSNTSGSMVYHSSKDWLKKNGLNTDFVHGIEIANFKNYLDWNVAGDQPMMVVHELAHAYHDQRLSFSYAPIIKAYNAAKASGIYERVRYRNSSGPLLKAYALNNEREYFAEMTEAYFGINDYYPFVTSELETHDPTAFNLMVQIWGSNSPRTRLPVLPNNWLLRAR